MEYGSGSSIQRLGRIRDAISDPLIGFPTRICHYQRWLSYFLLCACRWRTIHGDRLSPGDYFRLLHPKMGKAETGGNRLNECF